MFHALIVSFVCRACGLFGEEDSHDWLDSDGLYLFLSLSLGEKTWKVKRGERTAELSQTSAAVPY